MGFNSEFKGLNTSVHWPNLYRGKMQLHVKYSLCTRFSGIINFIIFKTKHLSRCSVFGTATRLRTGRSWYQMPPGPRFFYSPNLLQTPGFTQPGIRWVQGSFARNKAVKSCFWPLTTYHLPLTTTSDRRSLWVELYIGFLSMPTWLELGRHVYLTGNVESMLQNS